MSEKTFKIINGNLSDGYHTFDELYQHRNCLFIALCLMRRDDVVWKPHYDGWPVVFLKTKLGQISYHVPAAEFQAVLEHNFQRDDSYEWDGHTVDEALRRLGLLIGGLHSMIPIEPADPGAKEETE